MFMFVSIIIPTKNEPYINELVKKIKKCLNYLKYEIIVVDKSYNTPKISNVKIIKQKSDGLGNAFLEGLSHANGNVIVLMDGDGSHRPEDLRKLLNKINDYDIVIGSRFVKGGKTLDRTHRKFISFVFRKIASFVLNLKINDCMSGFSAIKMNVFKKISFHPIGYKINLEILYKSNKLGYKICEVPITFLPRKKGKSKSNFSEALRIIRYIFELKLGVR